MQIAGSSALVTGAGRGIGRATALALARAGARVLALARTPAELDTLAAEAPGQILPFPGDVRERAVCDQAVQRAVEAHGGLHILVNNAGIGLHAPVAQTSDDDWDAVIATNLTAVFRLTRAALPALRERGGHVFMVSSLAGSNAIAGMAAYCASKAALDHFAACLMLEVRGHGIKVTTLAPGSVDTSFGSGRSGDASWMLQAEDLADTVMALLGTRDGAHLSRIEMRPEHPPQKA